MNKVYKSTGKEKNDIKINLNSLVGSVYNNTLKITDLNKKQGTFTVQCLKCGTEVEMDLEQIRKHSTESLKCSLCDKETSLFDLNQKYLGKIYNGLKITNIYINEKGHTLCDVVCIHSLNALDIDEYNNAITNRDKLHIKERMALGDVINKRVYCYVCGDTKVTDTIPIKCHNLNRYNHMGIQVILNTESITHKDLYTGTSLCEYCSLNGNCRFESDPRNKFKTIASILDMQYSLTDSLLDTYLKYKNTVNTKTNSIEVDIRQGLMILGTAYIGRDNRVYRHCRCTQHQADLVLNDEEINNFNHTQCNEPYTGLLDISNKQIKERG